MNAQHVLGPNASNSHIFLVQASLHNWNRVFQLLKNSRLNIFVANPLDKRTILHYACLQKNRKNVVQTIQWIFDYIEAHSVDDQAKVRFINQKDNKGNTALQLTSKKRNQAAAELLIRNGANISLLKYSLDTNAMRQIYLPIFNKLFDQSLAVTKHDDDEGNPLLWSIHCDLGAVCGAHNIARKDCCHSLPQTTQLATMLQWKIVSKSSILTHPIVQIFLHFKRKRLAKLLYFIMLVQILWYLLSCAFIFCNTQIFDSTKSDNPDRELNLSRFCTPFRIFEEDGTKIHVDAYFVLMILVTIISIIKEIVRFTLASHKRKYWKQFGNLGRLGVIVAFIAVWIVASIRESGELEVKLRALESLEPHEKFVLAGILPSIFIFGMFSSLLLVQHQLSKTNLLGVYNEMYTRAFQSILKFGAAFLPFLFAFLITFHVLLPMRPEFRLQWGLGVSKIVTMMTGEVDYNGVVYGDDKDIIAFNNVLKAFLLVFVVTVVILLQNLLVGLIVSDVQKLEQTAKIKTLASLIEDIYLWENFLLWVTQCLKDIDTCAGIRKWLMEYIMVTKNDSMRRTASGKLKSKRLNEYPAHLREEILAWYCGRIMMDSISQSDA